MPENPKYPGSIETGVIDVSDSDQCQYWARRFVVPRDVLLNAVERVGTAACKVESELADQIQGERRLDCVAPVSAVNIGSLVSSGSVLLLQVAIA